jgi:hypothetical protein
MLCFTKNTLLFWNGMDGEQSISTFPPNRLTHYDPGGKMLMRHIDSVSQGELHPWNI